MSAANVKIEEHPIRFDAHVLEDLGLTLYTSLARVLVEFVANAYDADSEFALILYDPEEIEGARNVMRQRHKAEKTEFEVAQQKYENSNAEDLEPPLPPDPLEGQTLPDEIVIEIEDHGHGMSKEDFENKFLVASRRRREEDENPDGKTPNGRPLMGRKGLGKFAGFGVAKCVEVVSRVPNADHVTSVVMDYDKIKEFGRDGIMVPIITDPNSKEFPHGGTRIRLSRLLHGPTKNKDDTIMKELANHFTLIDKRDFTIEYNDEKIEPYKPKHAYAWPEPKRAIDEYVEKSYEVDGKTYTFNYRLRFTEDRASLLASNRGIRVYANHRLCAAPSLLDADTNMHGFRMADYLDGVVIADFIANQDTDYIATDRQGLRWESPLLEPMHKFLSEQIKEACKHYQKFRDDKSEDDVKSHEFTKKTIEEAGLEGADKKLGYSIAAALCRGLKRGLDDPDYKEKLPIMAQSIGHGTILTEIMKLAQEPDPDIHDLVFQTTRLTHDEFGRFMTTIRGRLAAIESLEKIVVTSDFKSHENEAEIQKLLEENPWLIDPTFTHFLLSADNCQKEMFDRLAKQLKIGKHAPPNAETSEERSDLVFLLGSEPLHRLIIVELKSANTPLVDKHLTQLHKYISDAESWCEQNQRHIPVQGILIGMRDVPTSTKAGVRALRSMEKRLSPDVSVTTYEDLLANTKAAHKELWKIHKERSSSSLS